MTRDWVKNSYLRCFITVIGLLMLSMLLCSGAKAADISVNPSTIDLSFSFNQPKSTAYYEDYSTFTITNINPDPNVTVSGSIGSVSTDTVTITPDASSFSLAYGESTTITLHTVVSPETAEGLETFTLDVGDESLTVSIDVIYFAEIAVSDTQIDFGTVHRYDNPSRLVTISEVLGYKDVTVTISQTGGNEWVTVSPDAFVIPAGSSRDVTFELSPGTPDHNDYSWTFSISTDVAGSASIKIDAYILMPPKLGELYDKSLTISFDKKRGTVATYERTIDLMVRNEGDETMNFEARVIELPAGINIKIDNPSGSVAGKSTKKVKIRVIAFYDASEGEHTAVIRVDAGSAGKKETDIDIEIRWPVGFVLSHSSIDFGSLEFKEGMYENRSYMISLTEIYNYKSVRRIAFSKSGAHADWLTALKEDGFEDIPPGESRNITITIQPGLEAVPGPYTWDGKITSLNAGEKSLKIAAKIIPINISMTKSEFEDLRGSELVSKFSQADTALQNAIYILNRVEKEDPGPSSDDWKKLIVLIRSTGTLITTLDKALGSLEGGFFDEAVTESVGAWVTSDTIVSHSEIWDEEIRSYALNIRDAATDLLNEVLQYEVGVITSTADDMSASIREAAESGDITHLEEGEDANHAARAYRNAELIYTLLGNEADRRGARRNYELMVSLHDDLVSDAGNLRFTAERLVEDAKEEDFTAIGNRRILLNPYNYDTAHEKYSTAISHLEDASKRYRIAGEMLLLEDTDKERNDLEREWLYLFMLFLIISIAYAFLILYAALRIIKGTVHYLYDIRSEQDLGGFLLR